MAGKRVGNGRLHGMDVQCFFFTYVLYIACSTSSAVSDTVKLCVKLLSTCTYPTLMTTAQPSLGRVFTSYPAYFYSGCSHLFAWPYRQCQRRPDSSHAPRRGGSWPRWPAWWSGWWPPPPPTQHHTTLHTTHNIHHYAQHKALDANKSIMVAEKK